MKIYNAVIAAVLASEKSYEYDFTDVFQAHEFVTKTADQLFNNLSFKTKRSKYTKNFKWFIENKLLCNLPVSLMIHSSHFLVKRHCGKRLEGRITAGTLRALQNNPGSGGLHGIGQRRCAKSQELSVSNETVQIMKDLADDENANLRDTMVSFKVSFLSKYFWISLSY